ncbi:MAG TPA: transposase, partial [Umezawaea sp.]|nr:transposase [Umezawaea sp.]
MKRPRWRGGSERSGCSPASALRWSENCPVKSRSGRPSLWSTRQLIDGIRWRVRVGASWRDVPATYGFWSVVCALFRRWQRAGVRQVVLTALRAGADAAGLVTWDVSVDSMIMRAHRHAAGVRKGDLLAEPPGGVKIEHGDHALGRPRGGWTTKVH